MNSRRRDRTARRRYDSIRAEMRDWRSEVAPTGRVARVRRYLLRSIWAEREGRGLAARAIERPRERGADARRLSRAAAR